MERPVYANSLTVFANQQKNEFVFTFKHTYPIVENDGETKRDQEDIVASIVVSKDLAAAVPEILTKILNEQVD